VQARDRGGVRIREQQRGCVPAEPRESERRDRRSVDERGPTLAHRQHDRDRLGEQAAEREAERVRARAVQPVRVVDEHGHRLLLGVRGEQAERRRADREPVAGARRAEGERALERRRLRLRDPVEAGQRRPEQLVQPGERDLRLRRDPAGTQQAHPRRPRRRVLEQRGLADPRLADERQHAAASLARVSEQALQRVLLRVATEEHTSILGPGPGGAPEATAAGRS
jgi:hypothetical protein